MSGDITDKVNYENGAEFMFVCSKIPFAMSCSRDLQHKNFNVIDLDLVNKMKIPLKKIRVSRITIQGQILRSVGVISQTIQCVIGGKISGTIHLYATVVRDLYSSLDVDSIASKRTFTRLMGEDPPDDPPDDNLDKSMLVLGGDDEEDDIAASEEIEEDDVAATEKEDIPASEDDKEDDIEASDDKKYDSPPMTLKEWRRIPKLGRTRNVCVYETSPGDCSVSGGDDDETADDDDDYLHDDPQHLNESSSGWNRSNTSADDRHCQFCFLSGQPIKVTFSHNDFDIACPSMSDVDRRRIHGDKETDRWLARIHGYND